MASPKGVRVAVRNNSTRWRRVLVRHQGTSVGACRDMRRRVNAGDGPKDKQDVELFFAEVLRWGWLKFMYIVTIVIAGGYGLGIIFVPDQMKSIFHTSCDPVPYGILGSLFLAFGLLELPLAAAILLCWVR